MIAKPSIAFNDFSGTAKEVTARNVDGRNILSVRAKQSRIVTPSQAVSRNKLSKSSRAYRQLSDSQMAAWEVLAKHLKGISTFGMPAELTAHNAFVRINANRALVGQPVLLDAPVYVSDVPEVDYEDFWVTPDMILFTGIVPPKDSYRLIVKMSPGLGNGVSSGWNRTVIVSPGQEDDWGETNITRLYTSKIGFTPKIGDKVFIELYWLDSETGFVGETMSVSVICQELSAVKKELYIPRNELTLDNISSLEINATIDRFYIEQAPGSALVMMDVHAVNHSYINGIRGYFKDVPDSYLAGRVYFPGRGNGRSKWAIGLYELYIYRGFSYIEWNLSGRCATYDQDSLIFATSAMVDF